MKTISRIFAHCYTHGLALRDQLRHLLVWDNTLHCVFLPVRFVPVCARVASR